ncbi:MAG TPA: DoxX family protein [Pyrinomonadaceae bacterium]|jgi:hypothetical protein
MKTARIIYWIVTGLLCLMMLASAAIYVFNPDEAAKVFTSLSYPTYVVYPLAIAKILGVAAIVTKKSKSLKEWAYAGFFFDFLLALAAHINARDGGFIAPVVALSLLLTSYFLDRKIYKSLYK